MWFRPTRKQGMSAVTGRPCTAEYVRLARAHGRQTQHTPTSFSRDRNVHEPVLDVTVHDCPSRAWVTLTTLSHPHSVPTPQTANVWTSGGIGSIWGLSTGGGTGTGVRSSAIACPPEHTAMTKAHMRLMNLLMCICRLYSFKAKINNGHTASSEPCSAAIEFPALLPGHC